MDGNAPRRGGSTAGAVAIGAAVVVLVAVVAIASRGSVADGDGGGARRPSETVADTLLSLFLLAMLACAIFSALALTFFRRYDLQTGAPRKRSMLRSVVTFVVSIALLVVIVRGLAGSGGERSVLPAVPDRGDSSASGDDSASYEPEFAVWPMVAVLTLLAVAALALWLSARRRRAALPSLAPTPVEALVDVLAETLDELRAERDPRRAVIAAYARMERALAAAGLPRGEAEAPEEYLDRVLEEIALPQRAAGRLTALFAWARFSVHDVRPEMKDEAIETLEQVQRELAAAEAAREAALVGAPL